MLSDKIKAAAEAAIEKQEGVPATAEQWRLIDIRHGYSVHKIFVSIMVTTESIKDGVAFEVWALLDLDTEEVKCLE